ncbi:MAG TPA: hypothetical protein PLF61_02425 [Candidatus Goldiibacteriota bacterium]|nr:hypothetical protein [Candidatus Goldiibacteriota bacterium]
MNINITIETRNENKTPRDWHKNKTINDSEILMTENILKFLSVKLKTATGNKIQINSPKKIGFPKKEYGLFISRNAN